MVTNKSDGALKCPNLVAEQNVDKVAGRATYQERSSEVVVCCQAACYLPVKWQKREVHSWCSILYFRRMAITGCLWAEVCGELVTATLSDIAVLEGGQGLLLVRLKSTFVPWTSATCLSSIQTLKREPHSRGLDATSGQNTSFLALIVISNAHFWPFLM